MLGEPSIQDEASCPSASDVLLERSVLVDSTVRIVQWPDRHWRSCLCTSIHGLLLVLYDGTRIKCERLVLTYTLCTNG